MRKYILAILLIFTGAILLIYTYSQNSKTSYSEALFSSESQNFDHSFTEFVNRVKKDIDSIKSNYKDFTKIKDTLYTQNFFLDFISRNSSLNAAVLIQNKYKVAVVKDKKSIVFTLDSLENGKTARWQRFENKTLISSWKESFETSVYKSEWYLNLNKNKDQIQWLFNVNQAESEKTNAFLYAGYSFENKEVTNTILLRFSRETILNALQLKYNNTRIKIESILGNQLNLVEMNSGFSNDSLPPSKSFIDSLNSIIIGHFKKFEEDKTGTFNFNFKNEIYWNSFNRFPLESGILYYLFTLPDTDLQTSNVENTNVILKWLALVLILAGLIPLFVRKRFFYSQNRIEIPSTKEILLEDENRYLEFKSSLRWDYRQERTNPELEKVVLKTLAAFGNTDGGILLIGVDDDKNIIGLEPDFNSLKKNNADFYEIHLRNILHNHMGVRYVSKYIRMQFEKCENGKEICKIKVLAAKEALYLKFKTKTGKVEEKFYVRSGNSSQEIKSIAEINDYINSRFK